MTRYLPTIRYGHGETTGRFFIVSAPPWLSERLGHGLIGLQWFRYVENYHQFEVFGLKIMRARA